jgi:hypothetical protein
MIKQSFSPRSSKQRQLFLCPKGSLASRKTLIKKTVAPPESVENIPKKNLQRIPYEKLIVISGLLT